MVQRFKNSWQLLSNSVEVLLQRPKLLLFPFLTGVSILLIVLFFFGAFLFQPTGHSYKDKAHWKAVATSVFTPESLAEAGQPRQTGKRPELQLNSNGMALAAGFYFFMMFLATFFNVAFYHEIIDALQGRPVGLRKGFFFALSKLTPILFWSLFAGLIGILIKQLERRFGLVGKIIINLIGLAWSVAAIFAIPVIVCEENVKNPIEVLKSSARTLKKTWGESLVGFVGLHLGAVLAIITSLLIFGCVMMFGALVMNSPALALTVVLGWVFFASAFGYFVGVASNVFQCALYVFASKGQIPSGYTQEMMDIAWKRK